MDPTTVAAYTAPAVIAVGGARWIVGWLVKRFKEWEDERDVAIKGRQEIIAASLDRIEVQTTKTNGDVNGLKLDVAMLKGTVYGRDALDK